MTIPGDVRGPGLFGGSIAQFSSSARELARKSHVELEYMSGGSAALTWINRGAGRPH